MRQLRSGKSVECVIMVNPYAICEWSSINTAFMQIVREYRYMDMDTFSITCDGVTGFIMYHGGGSIKNVSNRNARQPSKARLFYIQRNRNARTDNTNFNGSRHKIMMSLILLMHEQAQTVNDE